MFGLKTPHFYLPGKTNYTQSLMFPRMALWWYFLFCHIVSAQRVVTSRREWISLFMQSFFQDVINGSGDVTLIYRFLPGKEGYAVLLQEPLLMMFSVSQHHFRFFRNRKTERQNLVFFHEEVNFLSLLAQCIDLLKHSPDTLVVLFFSLVTTVYNWEWVFLLFLGLIDRV